MTQQYGKNTWNQIEEIQCFGYSYSDVLSNFVETILSALLSLTANMQYEDVADRLVENRLTGEYEDRYLKLLERFRENKTRPEGSRPIDFVTHAWAQLQIETYESQEDVLGALYEEHISLGEHGQFFTPSSITDMITRLVGGFDNETVSDPACGSGRFFISQAKIHSGLHFVGVDVSPVVARICALNMWLFNLDADIYQGNSLSMEMRYLWRIRPGGLIWEHKIENTVITLPSSAKSRPAPVVIPATIAVPTTISPATHQKRPTKKPVPSGQISFGY